MVYFETSALAKRYIAEAESAAVSSLFEENEGRVYTSRVTYAEVLSLLARAKRDDRIADRDYICEQRRFLEEWNALHVVEVSATCLSSAGRLVERYPLRGFDVIHLCAALLLGSPDFACFDSRLRAAGIGEGLNLVV